MAGPCWRRLVIISPAGERGRDQFVPRSSVTDSIERRPDPVPGTNIELGFLGTVIHAEIPNAIETQQSMSALPPSQMGEADIQVSVLFDV